MGFDKSWQKSGWEEIVSYSRIFNGPPSNKATAATIGTAIATLFWTIAAHTFWRHMNTADMTLYISTSTIFLTAIVSFRIPESAAFTAHSVQRLDEQAAAQETASMIQALQATIQDLDAKVQRSQQLDKAMADRLGIPLPPAISADGTSSTLTHRHLR